MITKTDRQYSVPASQSAEWVRLFGTRGRSRHQHAMHRGVSSHAPGFRTIDVPASGHDM